ncbi:MAG TPA: sulfate ABC transporter permease subunit CysT [Actinomycetota bacterium]|nr:sulfate ABC transporter permease subunit CysT [Actinomycetota bacterium]
MSTQTLERPAVPPPATPGAGPRRSVVLRETLAKWGLRGTAILYLGLLIALPTIAVISKGFSDGLRSLRSALEAPGAREAILLTLALAGICAVVNVIFGTLIAYVLVRYEFPGRSLLSTVVDIPFAIPTLVTGVMLRALYGPNSPIGGFLESHGIHVIFAQLGILLALLFVTLPLVVRTVQPVLLELDEAEEEAARVLGATRWYTFRRVVLPKLRAGIAGGGLLAFARAIGEFGAVVIVSGNIIGKTLTAPVLIFQLASQFQPNQAAAVATLLFAISFALVLVTERLVGGRSAG